MEVRSRHGGTNSNPLVRSDTPRINALGWLPARATLAGILSTLFAMGCGDGPTDSDEPLQIATVVVTSPIDTIFVRGRSVQLSAVARDASGTTLSGVQFTWVSSDTRVASVDASGLVNALQAGSATITATAQDGGNQTVSGSLRARVVATNLPGIEQLLNDPFGQQLVMHTTSSKQATIQNALNTCSGGTAEGNVVAIMECLEAARGEIGSATDPSDRALLAVLALYLDQIERFLAL